MESLGFDGKNQTIFQMISDLDKNKSGSIDFEELAAAEQKDARQEWRKESKSEERAEQETDKFSGEKAQTTSGQLKKQVMDKLTESGSLIIN